MPKYRIETHREAVVTTLDLERWWAVGAAFCFARSRPRPWVAWLVLTLVPLTFGARLDTTLRLGVPMALLATPEPLPTVFVLSVLLAVWSGCVAAELESDGDWVRMAGWVLGGLAALAGLALKLQRSR